MSLDSINPKNFFPGPASKEGHDPEKSKKKLSFFLTAAISAAIIVVWIIIAPRSFSVLVGNGQKISEVDRAREDFSRTMEELNDNLDGLKKDYLYSSSGLTKEEVEKVEDRLFENPGGGKELASTTDEAAE